VLAARKTGGLAGMQERATLLGGDLTVDSTPGHGTKLSAVLPLDTSGPSAPSEPME
jgi:signal transduction histidine kinase